MCTVFVLALWRPEFSVQRFLQRVLAVFISVANYRHTVPVDFLNAMANQRRLSQNPLNMAQNAYVFCSVFNVRHYNKL